MFYGIRIKKILKKILDSNLKISVAESCTGGLLSSYLTSLPGSSKVFVEGIVSYWNESKIKRLGVPEEVIKKHGAVSPEVAKTMAESVRPKEGVGIGVTGIAGPGGGTKEKPVGLVYFAVAFSDNTFLNRLMLKGNRTSIRKKTCYNVLKFLCEKIY